MNDELKIKMYSIMVDCNEPYELAKFYAELLNWEIPFFNEEWACTAPPGAAMAEKQFSDDWKVMIDPAGHPFCLCQMKSLFDNDNFALL